MKKSLITVLMVAVMVFAFAGVASAADEDIATKRLMSIDVVTGDPSGDLRLEDGITRAEFAAIAIRLRGMEDAAQSSTGATQFTDVKANAWYTGYINLASGNGIVLGDPEGTFRPNEQVNYAEAAAMLVRVLGYEPAVKAVGASWPNNYLSKAGELGLMDDVDMADWKSPARRGDVFTMADNALDVDLMKQESYGTDISYVEKDGETLLNEYLDVTVYDDDWADDEDEDLPVVTNTPRIDVAGLDDNEIEFDGLSGTYEVAEWINPDEFLGQSVEVWINDEDDDDVVIYLEADEDEEVLIDEIDGDISSGEIELDNDGDEYELNEDAIVYVDNVKVDDLEDLDGLYDGAWIKVVLNDDDEIVFADIRTYNADLLDATYIVEEVDTDDEYIDLFEVNGGSYALDLDDEDYRVVIDGAVASLEDIEAGDLVVVFENTADDEYLLEVYTDKVEGSVEDYDMEKSKDADGLDDITLEIDGEDYDFAATVAFTESDFDDIDDIDEIDRDEVSDLVDMDVVVYTNPLGDIVAISSDAELSGSKGNYGVIVSAATPEYRGTELEMTILNAEGEELDFTFDPEDVELTYYTDGGSEDETVDMDEDVDGTAAYEYFKTIFADVNDAKVVAVEYDMDNDGDLKAITLLSGFAAPFEDVDDDYDYLYGDSMNGSDKLDEDDDVVKIGSRYYEITDDTIVFDLTSPLEEIDINDTDLTYYEFDDPDIASWDDIADEDAVFEMLVDDGEVVAIYVTNFDGGTLTSDVMYGMVSAYKEVNGEDGVVILTPDDETVSYEGEPSERRAFIAYNLDGDEVDDAWTLAVENTDFADQEDSVEDAVYDVASGVTEGKSAADQQSDYDDLAEMGIDYVKYIVVEDDNGDDIEDENGDYYQIADDAVRFFIDDGEIVNRASRGDLVLLIDTDDDGSAFDFVVIIKDRD